MKQFLPLFLLVLVMPNLLQAATQFPEVTGASHPFSSLDIKFVYSDGTPEGKRIDYDNDGDQDFIVLNSTDNWIFITNDGSGNFAIDPTVLPFATIAVNVDHFHVVDLDNDGDDDLMISDNTSVKGRYFRNDNGVFSEITGASHPFSSLDIKFVYSDGTPEGKRIDYDNDGDQDFIVLNSTDNWIFITNDGSGNFAIDATVLPFATIVVNVDHFHVVDLDNDGDDDIMISDNTSVKGRYFRNDNGVFSEITGASHPFISLDIKFVYSDGTPEGKSIDYDSDGDQDFIVLNSSDNWIFITNDGAGNFTIDATVLPFATVAVNVDHFHVVDLDNDGDDDLMISDNTSVKGRYYAQNGTAVGSDNKPPAISSTIPLDNATDIDPESDIVLTFDELISDFGLGTINIYKESDHSLVESIAGNDSKVSGGGTKVITINPDVTLANLTAYYVLVEAGAFFDVDGMSFMKIEDPTALNFVTDVLTDVVSVSDNANIYPNPTKGMLNVKAKEGASYTIISISGRVVKVGQINNEVLNISNLSNGVYVLKIGDAKTRIVKY